MPRFRYAVPVTLALAAASAATPAYAGTGDVPVGAPVCITSPVTGAACGTVVALDATVSFPDGTVSGLSQTDLCVTADDDGVAVYSGETVVGHVLAQQDYCGMYYVPVD